MRRLFLLITLSLAVLGSISAQMIWQDELILRESNVFAWYGYAALSSDGGVYTIVLEQVYNHRNLCLYKVNSDGNLAWPRPIIICGGNSQKARFNMISTTDGNYIIQWQENQDLRITKIDPSGQPIWNPAIRTVFNGNIWTNTIKSDNNGGAYAFFTIHTSTGIVDIWGQHIDANGNNLFPGNGVVIASDPRQEGLGRVDVAPDGSILFSYLIIDTDTIHIYTRMMLLNSSLVPLWQANIGSGNTGTLRTSLKHFYPISDTECNLIWVEETNSNSKLYLNRINLQGSFMFPEAVILAENNSNLSLISSMKVCSDYNIILSIHNGGGANSAYNLIKKLSPEGISLWAEEITLPDSVVNMSVMRKDDTDGFDVVVQHKVGGSNTNSGYTLQHYSSEGMALYQGIGVPLIHSFSYTGTNSVSICWNSQYFVFYKTDNLDKYGVYYDLHTNAGELIGEPYRIIREGLNGRADYTAIQKRSDDLVVFWIDRRTNDGYRLYYQIVNPDGSIDLEENGSLLLSLPFNAEFPQLKTAYLEDGTTWIFFLDIRDNSGYLRGQAISASGELLYDTTGVVFHIFPNVQILSSLMLYSQDSAIFLAWTVKPNDEYQRTYLQKIENGQTQWGVNGLLISPSALSDNVSEKPLCFSNGFLVIDSQNQTTNIKTIWVQHLEPDGQVSPSWDNAGLSLCTYLSFSSLPTTENATVYNNKLLFCYSKQNQTDNRYHYYMLDSDCNISVTNQVLQIEDLIQSKINFDTTTGIAYTMKVDSYNVYNNSYFYGKVDDTGIHPWGELAGEISIELQFFLPTMLISGFSNGAYALSWEDKQILNLRFVTPQGALHPFGEDQNVSKSVGGYHYQTVLNNDLYVIWPDFKDGMYGSAIPDLRMQKFGNITEVAVADNYVSPIPLKLSCYPNPFSQHSNISFKVDSPINCDVKIYNLRGQLVKAMLNEVKEAGIHNLSWDGTDSKGKQVGSGVYFVRFQYGNRNLTAKLLRLR